MSITYFSLRGRIGNVLYREDLEPLIDEVKQALTERRIDILEEQDLLNYIDQRMQLPSRPPAEAAADATATEPANEAAAIAEMPPSHPTFTAHPANYIENNSDFQIIVDGGRRNHRSRRTARRNHRNRRTARRNRRA